MSADHEVQDPVDAGEAVAVGQAEWADGAVGLRRRRGLTLAAVGVTVGALSLVLGSPWVAAQTPGPTDAPATWRVDEAAPPRPDSTSFTALVTRLACNGGVTGEAQTPTVTIEPDRIVITFTVTPPPSGEPATCPSNDWVPFTVVLDQPIGLRPLVDGACGDGGVATGTSFCAEGGVRWSPAAPAPPAQDPRPVAVEPSFTG